MRSAPPTPPPPAPADRDLLLDAVYAAEDAADTEKGGARMTTIETTENPTDGPARPRRRPAPADLDR
jgi:hypothetical protein